MNQHRKFTKEFAAEALALLHSSGRTRRQVADDLGIGLSTLARWSRDSRDGGDGKPDASDYEDIVAELKRLRRENDVLRQERDILKKATVFLPRREVDEVCADRSGEERVPRPAALQSSRREPKWLFCVSKPQR
jgi:transposase